MVGAYGRARGWPGYHPGAQPSTLAEDRAEDFKSAAMQGLLAAQEAATLPSTSQPAHRACSSPSPAVRVVGFNALTCGQEGQDTAMLAAQPMAAQQNALETASALPPPDSEAAAAGDVGHPTHALIEPPTILLTTEEGPSLASICAAAAAAEDYTCCGSRECTCFRCTGVALPQDYLVFPCPLQRISFRPDYPLPDPGEEGPAMLMTHHEAICAPGMTRPGLAPSRRASLIHSHARLRSQE